MQWGVKIPMRDGVSLNTTVYQPHGQKDALPVTAIPIARCTLPGTDMCTRWWMCGGAEIPEESSSHS
jgi:predicted acyl esterase